VTGVRASNNNLATTVRDLFLDIIHQLGVIPSRIRGDHGVENLLVAALMEELQGIERGSYIWGRYVSSYMFYFLNDMLCRSVHNIRIERLWVDLTMGFGGKWKRFFQSLELYDGLDIEINTHLWLVHHLFLNEINQDAQEWMGAWNNHPISMRGQCQRSPKDLYFFSVVTDGSQGPAVEDVEVI